jgi:copper chaperone CopZ
VEKAAKQIDGVKSAKVDHRKGEAVITYDASKTTPEAIARTITQKTGFVSDVPPRK